MVWKLQWDSVVTYLKHFGVPESALKSSGFEFELTNFLAKPGAAPDADEIAAPPPSENDDTMDVDQAAPQQLSTINFTSFVSLLNVLLVADRVACSGRDKRVLLLVLLRALLDPATAVGECHIVLICCISQLADVLFASDCALNHLTDFPLAL